MNTGKKYVLVGTAVAAALAVAALTTWAAWSQATADQASDTEARYRIAGEALNAAVAVNNGKRGWSLTNGTHDLRVAVNAVPGAECGPVTVHIVATRTARGPVVAELLMAPAPRSVDAAGCATEFVPELVFVD